MRSTLVTTTFLSVVSSLAGLPSVTRTVTSSWKPFLSLFRLLSSFSVDFSATRMNRLWTPLVDSALNRMSSAMRENVFRVARHHVANGRPYEKVVIGTREVYKKELRSVSVTADHCTEGAPYPKNFYSNWELPCVPELTTAQYRKLGSGLRAGKVSSALREKNGSDRAYRRAILGEVKKSWNSGYDIEDYDNEKSLTEQQRRSVQWDLY